MVLGMHFNYGNFKAPSVIKEVPVTIIGLLNRAGEEVVKDVARSRRLSNSAQNESNLAMLRW